MNKTLYMIGGTMGVGKTTVCQSLKKQLNDSVFLDGDWCWDSHPFIVNEETKTMVLENISFLLNQYIHCLSYKNIIFCWVMHEQSIIDEIIKRLDTSNIDIKCISLICNKETLEKRLRKDIESKIREEDILVRSINRLDYYNKLNTIKINTDNKSVLEIVEEIINLTAKYSVISVF